MTSSKPQYPEPGSYEHLDPIERAKLHAEYIRAQPRKLYSDEEALKRQAEVEGISALAGREITDPVLRDIIFRHAKGEISAEEAAELGRQHILGE
ncbi:MAG: hypothetical protein Q4C87_07420 [Actinomycetaceae bacterium]|nr:hypothetical protein [Actinomycetaceae bacterium]